MPIRVARGTRGVVGSDGRASRQLDLGMPIRIVRLGTPRVPAEGLRLGNKPDLVYPRRKEVGDRGGNILVDQEQETLRELRANRPALEPATHSGFGRAAAWWHRQWVQFGTLAAASLVFGAALIRALSSPQVVPMMATKAIHRPADTTHQAVAVVPKRTIRPRSIAAPPKVGEAQISDRAIEDALVASITRALPEAHSAAAGAVPAPAVEAMPITAVEVPSQLPDSTAQNAEERARDLAAPKVSSGAGVVSGGVWQRFRDWMRGIKKPPVHSRF